MRILISIVVVGCLTAIASSIASVNPPPPPAADTAIRILFIADERLSASQTTAASTYLQNAWNGTNFSWPAGTSTTIQIANFGVPIPADESVFSGTMGQQLEKVRDLAEELVIPTTLTLRDFHGADVVIGLSTVHEPGDPGACGEAPQDRWIAPVIIPPFFPKFDSTGTPPHDLREANDSYVAVIDIDGSPVSCQRYLAAHEFGHLLGGGHWESGWPRDCPVGC